MQNSHSFASLSGCIDAAYESDVDEENFSGTENFGLRERRRKLHTEAEQRRRNAIKRGFEGLLELVHPVRSDSTSTARMSKATILQKAILMIKKLEKQTELKKKELSNLEKEVKALWILNLNYEKIACSSSTSNDNSVEPLREETRLHVFRMFSDALFDYFDKAITVNTFDELTASIVKWNEESCKPERLSSIMDSVLSLVFGTSTDSRHQSSSCLLGDTLTPPNILALDNNHVCSANPHQFGNPFPPPSFPQVLNPITDTDPNRYEKPTAFSFRSGNYDLIAKQSDYLSDSNPSANTSNTLNEVVHSNYNNLSDFPPGLSSNSQSVSFFTQSQPTTITNIYLSEASNKPRFTRPFRAACFVSEPSCANSLPKEMLIQRPSFSQYKPYIGDL